MSLMRLQVLREEQIQLLLDLGVLDPRADEGTAYRIWGALLADPIFRIMRWTIRDPKRPSVVPYSATFTAVASMSRAEKDALAERIIAACQPHKTA